MGHADAALANPASNTDRGDRAVSCNLPADDAGEQRYSLRVRLATIVGSVVGLWVAIWFGARALLHALDLG